MHGGSRAERLEADQHQSQPTIEAQHFHSNHTFEAPVASTNLMEADILSVKNSFTREILPPLAKRLAKAAALTRVLMAPIYEMVNAIDSKIDLMEIACSPTSSLTSAFEASGFNCLRVNHLSNFDLDTLKGTTMLKEKILTDVPKLAWVSLPCTRLSALQLLTPRDEEAWSRFEKKRGQDLRRASEVADALEPTIAETDFAWEWPSQQLLVGGQRRLRSWRSWPRSTSAPSTRSGLTAVPMVLSGVDFLYAKAGRS